jgi:protocatechuate 3,4-dioxygenase beta subunit
MQRREMLIGAMATSLGASWSARSRAETEARTPGTCVLTTTGDEGPFYFDAKLVRSNIIDSSSGIPLLLMMSVARARGCAPIKGARADVWHADADGFYSGYDGQLGTGDTPATPRPGRTFLRGTQYTDASGAVFFRTIYPSWYRGRTPHIHFKVFVGGGKVITNQIIFPEDVNDQVFALPPYRDHKGVRDTFNANDAILKRDMSGVLCAVGRQGASYRATLTVGVV